MNGPDTSQRAPYELRVPSGGLGAMDPRTTLLLWGGGSIVLGLVTSYLLIQGELRTLMLVLLFLLGVACLAPRRGVYILMTFLPFMYYIRRSALHFEEFSQRDPILLFPVLTTIAMCLGACIFYSPRVFHYFSHSTILKCCLALIAVFFLEMFNPIQGSLLIGIAGGMYFIIPILWVVLGLMITRKDLSRLFTIFLIIGGVTSAYGIYQHYFGMSSVEVYELKSKHFFKTLGGEDRVMSTFSGLVDFARYLTMSGFIAFAYFWRRKRALSLILLLVLELFAMLFTASRTSFLVTFFSMLMLLILTGSSIQRIVVRGLFCCVMVMALYSYAYQYDPQRTYNQQFSEDPFVVHTLSGVTHPTEEDTFQSRIKGWAWTVQTTVYPYVMGRGLGSTTTAAGKFEGGQEIRELDSYTFELFYGSGLAAPIFFITVAFLLVRNLLRMCLEYPDDYLYKIAFGLICGMLLSSVFGVTARDNITGPFMWLLAGWVAREHVDRERGAPPELVTAGVTE